jgi:pimeloyl-ACP methyl ester carboxylesterase
MFWLAGCTAAAPAYVPAGDGEPVTVFVHGYKGSFLDADDAGHTRAWLSVGQLLSKGDVSLALPREGQRTPPSFASLKPAGPLTRFTAVPLLISEDIYLGWLEFGRDHLPGFVPFAYDWRQDVRASGRELCDFLAKLPGKQLHLVGHSMGGMVIWSCLSENAEVAARVTRVVFAGTPFQGGPGIFKDLIIGTTTGRNQALLSRDALFTFPSAWQLLSDKGDFFVDAAGAPLALDAFDPSVWVARRWGIFSGQTGAADLAWLEALLAHHAGLRATLARPLRSSPRLLAVVGTGRPTVSAVRLTAEGFDFGHPATADGDGSVLSSSASPPGAFSRFDSGAEHAQLLNDRLVQAAIEAFLR